MITALIFKPYDLVTVRLDGYSFTGEVISMPIPQTHGLTQYQRYMVRRVPGDATTLDEYSDEQLQKSEYKRSLSRPLYVHYAQVDGRGSFPTDMLRYDHAAPVNFKLLEDDSEQQRLSYLNAEDINSPYMIARASQRFLPNWTFARWSSFLWGCRHLRTVKLTGS